MTHTSLHQTNLNTHVDNAGFVRYNGYDVGQEIARLMMMMTMMKDEPTLAWR